MRNSEIIEVSQNEHLEIREVMVTVCFMMNNDTMQKYALVLIRLIFKNKYCMY